MIKRLIAIGLAALLAGGVSAQQSAPILPGAPVPPGAAAPPGWYCLPIPGSALRRCFPPLPLPRPDGIYPPPNAETGQGAPPPIPLPRGGDGPSGGSAPPIGGGVPPRAGPVIARPSPAYRPRARPSIGTRMFTPARLDLPQGFGAVGVIAFPHPPASAVERDRAIAVCRAFLAVLPDSAQVSTEAPERQQMVTLWPRTDIVAPLAFAAPPQASEATATCARAVDNYAYVAADGWIAELPRGVRLAPTARGPVLIAWAPPASRGDPRSPVLTYDLSAYEQPATLVQAFGIWKREIESRPDLWKNGWDQTRWRLQAAAFADRYGAAILSALKLVPFLGGDDR